ncbi:cytochrome c [Amaricoccus solimangrovi]|uniref:Cytochrome c n=1 Tax=Amaricoccus solimangrovi TaxID=2589815 RepID=A0A501WKE6_9RHOB|nr:cytochrome c [Amaricoccus solimangrovi]TPE49242.1 cytochrome c [Amaricoccus solimangrovi]
MALDLDRLSPVEKAMARRRIWRWIIIALIAALIVWRLVFVNQYVVAYEKPLDHFLRGSIGSETANGMPVLVFKALPVIYRDRLGPGGWRHFGLLQEPGDDLPLGFSRRVVTGVERVWLNCSVCHVGTYRMPGESEEHYVYGAPSNNLRLYALIRFFIDAGRDPGFTADALVDAINSDAVGGELNFAERALYRHIVFPRVKAAFLNLGQELAFVERQEDWGPGRVDTFNPYKAIQFNFPMGPDTISEVALNGSSDYPSIWMQRPREGMNLHWDGNNSSVAERNLSAALGAGVTPVTVDRAAIHRIEDWMWDLPAPAWPGPVDAEKAGRGEALYAGYCAGCHGMKREGAYDYDRARHPGLGKVVPLPEIGTDPGRWASYTPDFAGAQNTLYAGYPWRFTHFHVTDGYVGQPLDGIWARSPYLHNGSVPTLRDLLEPAADRPKVWFRGGDVLDLDRVGYRSDPGAAAAFRYDTRRPGNSDAGHDGAEYGTALPASDKDAIVEYMKTL